MRHSNGARADAAAPAVAYGGAGSGGATRVSSSTSARGDGGASAFEARRQSVLSNASFSVALLPVGDIARAKFCEYASEFCKYTEVQMHNLTPPGSWKHGVLRHHSWQEGALRFTFLVDPPTTRVQWESMQAHLAQFVVIGICHCPSSPDLLQAFAEFQKAASAFPWALLKQCFAFDPMDVHWEDTVRSQGGKMPTHCNPAACGGRGRLHCAFPSSCCSPRIVAELWGGVLH